MSVNTNINDDDYAIIVKLSSEGNERVDADDFAGALKKFKQALDLVPDPKTDWEASTWLYASIGDMYFFLKKYKEAADSFYNALNCPKGIGNGFVYLRLGQSLFELGQKENALEYLLRAYMLEGEELFTNEKKYFNFLQDKVEL